MFMITQLVTQDIKFTATQVHKLTKNNLKRGLRLPFFVDRYYESLYIIYVIKREEKIMASVNTTIRPMTQAERQRAVEVVQVQGEKY